MSNVVKFRRSRRIPLHRQKPRQRFWWRDSCSQVAPSSEEWHHFEVKCCNGERSECAPQGQPRISCLACGAWSLCARIHCLRRVYVCIAELRTRALGHARCNIARRSQRLSAALLRWFCGLDFCPTGSEQPELRWSMPGRYYALLLTSYFSHFSRPTSYF